MYREGVFRITISHAIRNTPYGWSILDHHWQINRRRPVSNLKRHGWSNVVTDVIHTIVSLHAPGVNTRRQIRGGDVAGVGHAEFLDIAAISQL